MGIDLSQLSKAEKLEVLELWSLQRNNAAKESLIEFSKQIEVPGVPIPAGEDGKEYFNKNEPADHHRLMLEALENAVNGDGPKNIMLFLPPGAAKTTYGSIIFPAWFIGKFPKKNVIATTYNSTFAQKNARKVRSICKSEDFKNIFNVEISADNAAVLDWSLENGSTYMGGGVLSGITGNRADLLIVDDPFKNREEADSKLIRNKLWDEWIQTLCTRLKPDGIKVMILTRWHEDDLPGRILPSTWDGESGIIRDNADSEDWFVIRIPAECDREDDPLGREIGEFLWTNWFTDWDIRKKQADLRTWNSLYQQKPTADEGNILRKSWWKLWPGRTPPSCSMVVQSYDTAFTVKDSSDFTARTTWGVFTHIDGGFERTGVILLEALKKRVEYPELRNMIIEGADIYKPDLILIEDKGSGQSLGQELRKTTNLPIKMIQVKLDKITRAYLASGYLEGGAVWYIDKPWAHEVIESCASFPNAAHDDDVDTCTQLWNWLRKGYALDTEHDTEEEISTPKPKKKFYG